MIRVNNVSKSFDGGQTFAVRDLTLDVRDGETLVLLGSSGCGKSTTLKLLNRLLDPTSGSIEVDGTDIRTHDPVRWRRGVGYVFQGIGLFPHMTVRHNVEIGLRLLGWQHSRRKQRSREMLELVELPPDRYAQRLPEELSGGQQQRVGVARALAPDPDFLLMDEPFGALDALTRDTLQQQVLSLKRELQKTIVFVTHDLFEALAVGDRLAVMHAGRLEQIGPPQEILGHPATEFVRDLFAKPAKQLAAFRDTLE